MSRVLTTTDIKLIRTADDAFVTLRNGEASFRVSRGGHSDVTRVEAELSGFPARVTDYGATYSNGGIEQQRAYRASAYVTSCRYNEAFKTFAALIRAGDAVAVEGIKDNNNKYITDAGLHHDSLWLNVQRGKRSFRLFLADSTCPDNSARMFQRA